MLKLAPIIFLATFLGFSGVGICQAQTLDWIERYALANDRSTMLSELIPGSEDHYFYHCLNHQVIGEVDKAEALLTSRFAFGHFTLLAVLGHATSPRNSDERINRVRVAIADHPPRTT